MPGQTERDDWATIWQSELAARVVDRESQEMLAAAAAFWTTTAAANEWALHGRDATGCCAKGHDGAAGRTWPDAAAWAAAIGFAPDVGGHERTPRPASDVEREHPADT